LALNEQANEAPAEVNRQLGVAVRNVYDFLALSVPPEAIAEERDRHED
jgi:hypothetical protein